MVSPKGREFTAKWRGSNRSKSKKLGTFSPPKKTGTVVQDLDIASVRYPMSIYFDGENHDLESNLFFLTANETGRWEVTHPVHGKFKLQLVSILENNQPITDGNYTKFDLEWVEPIDDDQLVSSELLAEQIQAQLKKLNQASLDQIESIADQNSSFSIQSLKNAYDSVSGAINNGLAAIANFSADIARVVNGIQRATTAGLSGPLISVASLSSQIQLAAQLPSLAIDNVQERLSSYKIVGDALFGKLPDEITVSGRNEVAVKELALTALLGTMPQIISTGPIKTRSEALNFAQFISDYFKQVTDELDLTQDQFSGTTIDVAYFSQSNAYGEMSQLIALSLEFLLRASFDAKIEKRFKIKKDRTPIDITISEYGSLGDNDENLDDFISSNKLKGDEILLIPAGREVVVYV